VEYTRAVWKVSGHFEYLQNQSLGLDVTLQSFRWDLNCSPVNSLSPVGLVSRQWDAVDWDCVLCDRRIHNDRASRSASSRQCACPFYSCHAGFFFLAKHHPGLSAPLQPRFGSLRVLAFPKDKIAVEREEICECDCYTVHKLSQRRLTSNWLASRESDCLRMSGKVSSDWLPSYIKATRPVLEIFKMDQYFPDSPRTCIFASDDGLLDFYTVWKEISTFRNNVLPPWWRW